MTFVNEQIGTLSWQTVDHEKGAVLKRLGSTHGRVVRNPQGGQKFSLEWQNESFFFTADRDVKEGKNPNKHDCDWFVVQLDLPETLKPKYQEVFKLIEDGLREWGWLYDRDWYNQVTFDFSRVEQNFGLAR